LFVEIKSSLNHSSQEMKKVFV